MPERLYTTQQVADALGISPRRVIAIARYRGIGQQLGREWAFHEVDIDTMRPHIHRKAGRPRKQRQEGQA